MRTCCKDTIDGLSIEMGRILLLEKDKKILRLKMDLCCTQCGMKKHELEIECLKQLALLKDEETLVVHAIKVCRTDVEQNAGINLNDYAYNDETGVLTKI